MLDWGGRQASTNIRTYLHTVYCIRMYVCWYVNEADGQDVVKLTEVVSALSRHTPAESCGQRQSLNRQGTHLRRSAGSDRHSQTEYQSNHRNY